MIAAKSDMMDDGRATMHPSLAEIAAGLAGMALVGFGGAILLLRTGLPPAMPGLLLTGWSALAGFAGFGAAWVLRRRAPAFYGVRPVARRWLLIGAGAGIVAFLAKGLLVLLGGSAIGLPASPQEIYATGGSGGTAQLVTATILLGILTPVGEEFLFRGVVTNGLLRFGALVGVVGGAVIFALMHGINIVLPVALLLGLVAGDLFRRTRSVWPGTMAHIVYNLPTIPVMVMAQAA
ncbi:CPBP family intramembrane glutamic endopeptidase [Croceibacterium mercuriale]|nr:type II CAAX endopeptidase family protein [Croceibacterium mercuriale]